MTNEEIRSSVDEIYKQIEVLEEKLNLIRAECKHEKKVKGINFEFVISDCLICETCGDSFPMPDAYYKKSTTKRGKRGKKKLKSKNVQT